MTVIAHFYNEQFLLPYWLKHHRQIFDHGIMINYASTDRSVKIIKELVPDWTIVDSFNQKFHAELVDYEVMRYEEVVDGWKMVLNITEFFLPANLEFTKVSEPLMLRTNPFFAVDMENSYEYSWPKPKPIINTDIWGFSEYEQNQNFASLVRARYFHNLSHGSYESGRHSIEGGTGAITPEHCLLYVADYPRSKEMLKRKLQIKGKLDKQHEPPDPNRLGHYWDKQQINDYHNRLTQNSYPLNNVGHIKDRLLQYAG